MCLRGWEGCSDKPMLVLCGDEPACHLLLGWYVEGTMRWCSTLACVDLAVACLPPAVLVWSLYFLGTHPEVQEKLYQEALQHVGREGPVRYEDIKEMG